MSTTNSWTSWIILHATTFGFSTEAEMAMLKQWAELFDEEKFTVSEMTEATKWVALHDPPRFRTDHLRSLQTRVRSQRAAQEAQRGQDESQAVSVLCRVCGDSGLVEVVGIKSMRATQLAKPFYFAVVCCICPRGEEKRRGLGKVMCLEEYESVFRDWHERWQQLKRFICWQLEAERDAEQMDKHMGPLAWKRALDLPEGSDG